MTSKNKYDALDKYLESDGFKVDMESYIAEENAKNEKYIEFSKTNMFQEILVFIKNRDSLLLNDTEKDYTHDSIPFSSDDIQLFFNAFYATAQFSDDDEFEAFSTRVFYLNDFVLYRVDGQGTIQSVSYIPDGDFNLNLCDEDLKELSEDGWTFGKENGLFFAKNELFQKYFFNKYFTFVKKYVYSIHQIKKKLQDPEFILRLMTLGYSIVSETPPILLHIDTNDILKDEDATCILYNINTH
jgi:hypothetical protein